MAMSPTQSLPAPPNPSGINQWPPQTTDPVTVATGTVTTESSGQNGGLVKQTTNVSLIEYYDQIFAVTVAPPGSASHSVSVTEGVTTEDSATQSFGVAIGMEAGFDLDGFSAKISTTLTWEDSETHSVSFTNETTTTDQFEVSGETEQVSVVLWQLVQELQGTETIEIDMPFTRWSTTVNLAPVINRLSTFVQTQYPATAASQGQLGRQMLTRAAQPL